MVKIRLSRYGSRNKPSYRLVVTEEFRKRGGKNIEVLGYWFPYKKDQKINTNRLKHWISLGVKPTKTASRLLKLDYS